MIILNNYNNTIYEWNLEKAQENITNHGISFKTATFIFDNEITYDETQFIENERCLKTVGLVLGFMLTVISTERNDSILIISVWSFSAEEIKLYIQEINKQRLVKNWRKIRKSGGHRHE